jgi:hypothetical protein
MSVLLTCARAQVQNPISNTTTHCAPCWSDCCKQVVHGLCFTNRNRHDSCNAMRQRWMTELGPIPWLLRLWNGRDFPPLIKGFNIHKSTEQCLACAYYVSLITLLHWQVLLCFQFKGISLASIKSYWFFCCCWTGKETGSGGRASVLQVWSPEFKPKYHTKTKQNKNKEERLTWEQLMVICHLESLTPNLSFLICRMKLWCMSGMLLSVGKYHLLPVSHVLQPCEYFTLPHLSLTAHI